MNEAQKASVRATKAWNREHHPCAVPGCKFVRYRGRLCREHWRLVPQRDVMEWTSKAMQASHDIARKGQERATRKVLAQLRADGKPATPSRV